MLDVFARFFEKTGVDYPVLRRILMVKLTLDQRKSSILFNQKKKKQKPEENGFMKSLWIYVLFSLMMTPFVVIKGSYFVSMSIFFGMVMFLVMTSMISDFSSVLLDLRDKNILQTRPVDKRTITIAKSLHIGIYLFFLTSALTAIPLIAALFTQGVLFVVVLLLELIAIDLFIVVLTALVYFFILRFFDGQKLKDVINYVQIGLTIGITVGYQFLGRTYSLIDGRFQFTAKWWEFMIPPIWFSAPFEVLLQKNHHLFLIALSFLALLLPILGAAVYFRMMPTFESNLQKLANNSGKRKVVVHQWKSALIEMVCRSNEERAFYRFSLAMIRNEREFRLKVYPSIGLAFAFPFIMMMNKLQGGSYSDLVSSKWYLSLYLVNLMVPITIHMLKYSGKYKGRWIFQITPLSNMGAFYRGLLKVFLIELFLPIFLLLAVIITVMFGVQILPDILIMLITSILFTVVIFSLSIRGTLPFSEAFEAAQQTEGVKNFLYFLPVLLFILLHYLALSISFGTILYLFLLVLVTGLTWRGALYRL